jgi:IS1 family transposase
MESFEANRYQPVTVPVLIDRKTFFIVSTAVGPLRRKGRLTTHQRSRRAEHEAVHGRRRSGSLRAVRRVLSRLIPLTANQPVVLESDHKQLYGRLGLKMFGSRFAWRTHSATARRDRGNPLFPINHTNARLRHFLARLRRRTWCVSKSRFALQEHLQIVVLWANWCRGITNRTRITPAQALGVATRPYRPEELMAWRELWPVPTPTPRSSGIFI